MHRALAALIAFAVVLGATPPAGAGTLGDLYENGGFVDARLGDPIESFTGLELIGTDDAARTQTYIRRSDDLRIGGAEVDGVTYSFYDGRLYFISVRMTGTSNAEAVLAALQRTFGTGIETGTRPNERIWPTAKVFVLYDLDAATKRGLVAMTSSAIHAQMRMDRVPPPAHIDDSR